MSNLVLSDDNSVAPSEVFFDGQSMTEYDIDAQCLEIIQDLQDSGDDTRIAQAVKNLNGVERFAARAKAKLVYAWSVWYEQTKQDDFVGWYAETFGGDELTVQKHQAIGELLSSEDVPDEVKERPNRDLISVARAVQSGYDLSDHWDELARAGSEAEVNDIIRKVKGKDKRAGSLDIVVSSDGSIVGWEGGEWVSLGWLNFADLNNDKMSDKKKAILEKGTARIVNNTRMRRK